MILRLQAAPELTAGRSGRERHRCGFSSGWSVRAYEDSLTVFRRTPAT